MQFLQGMNAAPRRRFDETPTIWHNMKRFFLWWRPRHLVNYQALIASLVVRDRSDRGYQVIPVEQIVGSVGRYSDFDADFTPLVQSVRLRCDDLDRLISSGKSLPLIEVYQIGSVYFVVDGNHRVAVYRAHGVHYIDAHVVEIRTNIQVTSAAEARALYTQDKALPLRRSLRLQLRHVALMLVVFLLAAGQTMASTPEGMRPTQASLADWQERLPILVIIIAGAVLVDLIFAAVAWRKAHGEQPASEGASS